MRSLFLKSHSAIALNFALFKTLCEFWRKFCHCAPLNLLWARNAATVAAALHRKVVQELHLLVASSRLHNFGLRPFGPVVISAAIFSTACRSAFL